MSISVQRGEAVAAGGPEHAQPHEMHLPHGSWWPFILAVAMALLGIGVLVFGSGYKSSMHKDIDPLSGMEVGEAYRHWGETYVGLGVLVLGVLAVVGALAGWFVQDHKWWWQNVGTGTHIPKVGALLFISSEIFLFGALFANYFTFQSLNAGHWPDAELELPLLKTGIFTLFLFASSGTIHMAEHNLKRGHHKAFVNWWGLTILLGAVFLGGQVMEYSNLIHEGHTLGSSQFITAFYILTGAHGLHVFGGLCLLLVMWLRARKGQFTPERHAGPMVASMYWHFVDIVWVFVFSILYVAPLLGH
ncbi:MAG: cytochrome c oxidase subunit [Thermoplasmata archaeon]|jgi:cytochrome c oxidase subunit 3|nr:cytochrome c oxidase subunit [Thermoplasmata archaeon]